MKIILTPVDFSAATAHIIQAATDLANAVDGQLVLLHVVQPPMVTSDYGLAMENVQEILAVSEKAATRQLAHLSSQLADKDLSTKTVQANGVPVATILEQATKLDADYIVMGSHGHTALYDLLVGSTTHGVLMKAPCPVLIVPPSKKKKAKKK
jgi:nucleotide-binding universal stress UspA family protein